MTTVNEDHNHKTKVRNGSFFVAFRSFVLLPNSMSKLIHNRCTCKLIITKTAVYVHFHEQLRRSFYVLVHYFAILDVHL